MKNRVVIAWHYAGNPSKPLLFAWQGPGPSWGCDPDASKAVPFPTVKEAAEWWLGKHAFPEDYEDCIFNGYLNFFDRTESGLKGLLPLL